MKVYDIENYWRLFTIETSYYNIMLTKVPILLPKYFAQIWTCTALFCLVQDEDISRTLDRAIEAARSMKRRTDRMAESLSADLAKAELQSKLYPRQRRENKTL